MPRQYSQCTQLSAHNLDLPMGDNQKRPRRIHRRDKARAATGSAPLGQPLPMHRSLAGTGGRNRLGRGMFSRKRFTQRLARGQADPGPLPHPRPKAATGDTAPLPCLSHHILTRPEDYATLGTITTCQRRPPEITHRHPHSCSVLLCERMCR